VGALFTDLSAPMLTSKLLDRLMVLGRAAS
jgi:hypothetical protein